MLTKENNIPKPTLEVVLVYAKNHTEGDMRLG